MCLFSLNYQIFTGYVLSTQDLAVNKELLLLGMFLHSSEASEGKHVYTKSEMLVPLGKIK